MNRNMNSSRAELNFSRRGFLKWSGSLAAGATLAAMANAGEAVSGSDPNQTRNLEVDFSRIVGQIRPLHGVNCGPISENFFVDLSPLFQQLSIPYVRLVAPNFPAVNCVSVHTIFRDFDADPEDPANYDFRRTDAYIAAVIKVGAQPIYNLSNWEWRRPLSQMVNARPTDSRKWARICVNIIRHYNEGWANGQRWNIRYWEIWNEPDLPREWDGTVEQYVDLYATVSRAIKAHDPALKVGGPAAANPSGSFLDKFLGQCVAKKLPLDFCSWHAYCVKPALIYHSTLKVDGLLKRHGLSGAENQLNEWSPLPLSWPEMRNEPLKARTFFERNGGAEGGAFDTAVLTYLQDSPVNIATFYSGDTLRWGFADRNGAPKRSFFAFKAFVQTLQTPQRVHAAGEDKPRGLAVLAGLSDDKTRASILISNFGCPCRRYALRIKSLPWKGATLYERLLVDHQHELEVVDKRQLAASEAIELTPDASAPSVCLIRLAKAPSP
jgi:hypothetical protein